MATLNKYHGFSGVTGLGMLLRRRWVILKLQMGRLAGIGRSSYTVHDLFGFLALITSFVYKFLSKVISTFINCFFAVVSKILIYVDPISEHLAKLSIYIRTLTIRIRSHSYRPSRMIPIMLLTTATVCICTVSFLGVGLKVMINGQPVGYVSSKSEMESILTGVEDRVSEYLGSPYSLNLDVSYAIGYDDGNHKIDKDYIANYVMSSLNDVSTKYVLTVDGEVIGANQSKTALELLKQRMLEANATSYKGGKVEFVQDVEVRPMGSLDATLMSVEEIESKLLGNKKESVTYTVCQGDTVSGIAQKFSTSVSSILAINPGLQSDKIHVGQNVTVSASTPCLAVKETVTESYVQRLAYETTKTTTDQLYTTQSRVVTSGVYGEASVVADVVYVNGAEQSRIIMNWQVTNAPVNEVIEVGTKTPPAKSATGTFRKPSNGVFSSGYGYRKNLGDFHTGVDFAGAIGTAIYAADGGKVTYAGWKGNYGYCVFIDHGNGFVTLYAHCSKLLVKQGQSVAKGENIARVGSTGRSTGPHVHFEVRYNGNTVNPMKYISK
ncbi:MAG: peptidoglycan DD-metalloendopeptidase family protein [Clostridiaceae bacterium]|nr:peptidoglycan DD-metalloendopeptidase family protein [Clostridiaceae bacterium]